MASKTIIEESEWNGIPIKFYPKSHTYHVKPPGEGWRKVPSVTTVLNTVDGGKAGALAHWAARLASETVAQQLEPYTEKVLPSQVVPGIAENARTAHTRKKDKAGDAGTQAHEWLEKYCYHLRDGTPKPRMPQDQGTKWIVERGLKFFESHEVEPIHIETRMAGEVDGIWYAGTVDLVALVDGDLWMIDFKTSNHPSWTHVTQMAGYEWTRPGGQPSSAHCVLYIDLKSTARVAKGQSPPYWACTYPINRGIMQSWSNSLKMYQSIKDVKEVLK